MLERRRHHLESFNGRQHGQRRCDDRVAIEQGAADDAEQNHGAGTTCPHRPMSQRHQRQGAAFPIVVGAQQNHDVLDRNNEDQRPNDERKDAKHDGFVRRIAGTDCGHHGLAERIEGARADVAVDDADRAER
jgi:hypothetical protein